MIYNLFYITDRREINGKDIEEIKEPNELLDYLDKKYLVFNNIVYLQGLFLACKAPELYDRCLEYAKNRGKEITYFEAKILKSGKGKFFRRILRLDIQANYVKVRINNFYLLK